MISRMPGMITTGGRISLLLLALAIIASLNLNTGTERLDATGGVDLNNSLSLTGQGTSFNGAPQADAPAGVFTISATFSNSSTDSFEDIYFEVTTLSGGNLVLNCDGGPGGPGCNVPVPASSLGADGVLSPGESFTVDFAIGLQQRSRFSFFVDALGSVADDVSATFDESTGILEIVGDQSNNTFDVSRMPSGEIVVNGGAIPVQGDVPTVSNTSLIRVFGKQGNDQISIDETNGPLPPSEQSGEEGNDLLIGGNGVDTLLGGNGNDTLIGGRGNDVKLGESGDDLLIWNNGDGSDLMEGGADDDTVQVNGADGAGDDFSIDPNGARVRFQRNNLGLFALDIGTTEDLDVNSQGGDDVIAGSTGLNGLIELDLDGGEGNDLLIGGDGVDTLRGGNGNDALIGGRGDDIKLGDSGNDLLIWNNGDGSDLMEGGADDDTVQVNGANGAGDDFFIGPNSSRVRFQRNNLGLFSLDIGTTEDLDVNSQGGDDVIAGSGGLDGLIELDLDGGEGNDLLIGGDGVDVLRGGNGNDVLIGQGGNDIKLGEDGDDLMVWNNGDGSDLMEGGAGSDSVQVNGDNSAGDDFSIGPDGSRVRFQRNNLGTFTLDIGTTELLDVNGRGGNDVIAGSIGLDGLVDLDLDGGPGLDTLTGGDGPDVLRGGDDDDSLNGSDGDDTLLGQDGNDSMVGGNGTDFCDGGIGIDTAVNCETVVNVP